MCDPISEPFSNRQTERLGLSCFNLHAGQGPQDRHQPQQHRIQLILFPLNQPQRLIKVLIETFATTILKLCLVK